MMRRFSVLGLLAILSAGFFLAVLRETYWAVMVDWVFDHLGQYLGIERARIIAVATPFLFAGTAALVLIYAAYRFGAYERVSFEPTPDVDPRKVFEQILANKIWLRRNTETDPEKLQCMVSNYLSVRLDGQIHDALVQHKISAWGERDLPGVQTGPLAPIPPEIWHEIEIVFGPPSEGQRAVAKFRTHNMLAYFGIKLCAAEIAKYFHISKRRLLR
jgi:hypothetical protein